MHKLEGFLGTHDEGGHEQKDPDAKGGPFDLAFFFQAGLQETVSVDSLARRQFF